VYNSKQRQELQREADSLVDEYNRIVAGTSFNGRRIFTDGSREETRVQPEYGVEESIAVNLGASLSRRVGTGTLVRRIRRKRAIISMAISPRARCAPIVEK